METGFLNPIHEEEQFQSSFYSQENGLDGTENMLFGEMIVPEIIDYDNLWHSVEDMGLPSQCGESGSSKEDLQRMVFEWQNQLTYMQEPEVIKQILPVAEKTTQEVSDILSNTACTSSPSTSPSLDDLFPLEHDKDNSSEDSRENTPTKSSKTVAAVKLEIKEESAVEEQESAVEEQESAVEDPEYAVEEQESAVEEQEYAVEEPPKQNEEVSGDVDVETVEDEVPLLMAGDLTSLLEQFEATERVNSEQPLIVPAASPPRPSTQTIREALPPEVINRIKASRENHKKVSIIPAIPSKRAGRTATRMQDAGVALSRNKLLKLVTGGPGGESVQLDHDYCTNGSDSASNSSRSYYVSDSSEYPSQASTPDTSFSRVPEFYTNMLPQKLRERTQAVDNGSRKDSGLESGENSDEDISQHVNQIKKELLEINSVPKLKSINVMTENGLVIGSAPVIRNLVPMVSVLKKNNIKLENDMKVNFSTISPNDCFPSTKNIENTVEVSKKKKKLNLEEYRVRREERERVRSQESSRASSPIGVSCGNSPAQPDSTTMHQEGVSKEKPTMLSVEVQTQTCDFIDLTSSSPREHGKSRKDRKEKRNDLKHKSYRSRYASTSSSSSSVGLDRYHSHRRKRRSRSNRRHKKNSVSRMWSRSPSRSSSSSRSASSRSRSRSRDKRQKWRSRSPRRSNSRYSNNRSFRRRDSRDKSWQRSRSPARPVRNQEFESVEKVRQIEERRVIYVGRIEEGTTKADLRSRFQQFGPIVDISVHFRERGDNYGFVTFAYKIHAYRAVEHGNDDPKLPRYDLCFGGRRAFCKQRYADLDGMATSINNQYGGPQARSGESFDLLLHEVKSQLRKRSSV